MKALLKSFGYAFCGIFRTVLSERNMRIHLVAAVYVLLFSLFFSLSSVEYAILLLTIAAVIAAELINTAIEATVDLAASSPHPLAKTAKDAAAGAVLVLALFAVGVAICLFCKPEGFVRAYDYFTAHPVMFIPIGLLTVLSVVFVCFNPAKFNRKHRH